jgi:predicted phage terminase large subunit-like protein
MQWTPGQRREFLGRLDPEERARLLEHVEEQLPPRQWATPGELAAAIDPATVQTPALGLIDEALVWAYTTPGARLAVSMPPQEGKSSRVTKTGSLWALTRDPELRIGIVSYAQSLADGFGREIRNLVVTHDGTDGTLDLGLRVAPDYGSARRWQLDGHRGGVVAAGVGSGLTGRPLDAICVDDPFADAVQAGSAYYRDRVWDWWQTVGSTRLAPDAPVLVICTRWHEDDFVGRLLSAEDGSRWRVVNIPALADHKPEAGESDPLGRDPGEWLESARGRTRAQWEQIRIQAGSRAFTALYQGRPSPDQGNVWQRQWWRRYHEPLWSQHPDIPQAWLVHDADEVLTSVDCAFKDTKSSDFVVMQIWARRGAMVFLVDQVRKRLSFTDTVTALLALVAKWPQASRKLIEDKANGSAVISMLRSKVPGLVPVNPTDSKYGRATAVAPFIESGNVLLPSPDVGLFDAAELIEEAAGFPNAAHDDQVDATSQALAELLLDGNGAQAWISWARRKAEQAAAEAGNPAASSRRAPEGEPPTAPEAEPTAAVEPEAPPVPLDPAAALREARHAAYRAQRGLR